MRQVARKLRLELAQFRELEAFAKFGSEELDKATKDQLERGRRITEVLKQPVNTPMSLGKQSSILYAVTNGYLDDLAVEKVIPWEENFHRFMETNHPDIEKQILTDNEIKPETENRLKAAIAEYKKQAV
jgi:F-type H+-transporting ATPase subunit alpha